MNFKRKLLVLFSILTLFMPINVLAYSSQVILGGENIGISVNTKEVLVVGFYKVNNEYIAQKAGFALGDRITKVNGKEISSIEELVSEINKANDSKVTLSVKRDNIEKDISLNLVLDKDVYKTGLYIKDEITGIGTLTYIDPETKIFGSLGHEIADSKTGKLVSINDGYIFESSVTGTIKSTPTTTGEKRAIFKQNIVEGDIVKNTNKGIYGNYSKEIDEDNLIDVAEIDEIELGPATIYTVLHNNEVKAYNINILNINKDSETKNILFEITDDTLMEKTNGVIKGMSGSPIVQNNKIIGAVTHAIVSDNTKGYGIFITSMLEEGEK